MKSKNKYYNTEIYDNNDSNNNNNNKKTNHKCNNRMIRNLTIMIKTNKNYNKHKHK